MNHKPPQPKEDPYLINPKGRKVQVKSHLLQNYLKQGYVLDDKQWEENVEEPATIGDELKVEKV